MSSEPIGVSGLAGRYATALYELADEQKKLDEVADDLATLLAMTDDSDDLRRMLLSPVVAREEQGAAIEAVMERAGMSELTRHFVGVVAKNGRLFAVEDMARAYRAILADRRGEVTAEVTSATALSDAQQKALTDMLKSAVGSNVAIDAKVDPDILGGLVVRVGSRMVDSSLRTKLQKLQFVLKGAA